jgi:DNA-binding MarR family transcriptional regulator
VTSQVLTTQASAALDVWVRLLRGHAALTRELNAELTGEHGLTINDFEALLLLSRAENGSMRRVDLADQLTLTPSGVTRLLDGLERAGLVAKGACATDLRVTYAVITDAGRERLETAAASHLSAVRAAFEQRFSDDELATLRELLGRLPGAASADGADCSPPAS